MRVFIAMKKFLVLFFTFLLAVSVNAQDTHKLKSISLTTGVSVNFEKNEIDSVIIILNDAGDTLGVKVYCNSTKGEKDFLYRYVTNMTWWDANTNVNPIENINKNSADDLKRNREGWRLEFPRFYQGTNKTFEVTHSTVDYGITYSLEWDGTLKANRWTCYELYAENMKRNVGRSNDFKEDTAIPAAYRSTLSDYRGSGYSRGHLCPSSDRLCSREQNSQTFFLSNMQPQIQDHNGGVWAGLENKVRVWAEQYDTLYVVKAATIDAGNIMKYTSSGLIVPKYFYMALLGYTKATNSYQAVGIWSPHAGGSTTEYISIKELEKRTGIDFFCNLPDEIEKNVESNVERARWN